MPRVFELVHHLFDEVDAEATNRTLGDVLIRPWLGSLHGIEGTAIVDHFHREDIGTQRDIDDNLVWLAVDVPISEHVRDNFIEDQLYVMLNPSRKPVVVSEPPEAVEESRQTGVGILDLDPKCVLRHLSATAEPIGVVVQ